MFKKFNYVQLLQIVLRATQTPDLLIFSKKKKVSSDVWSEIHLVQHNIASTGQAVRALKKSQLTAN